jgi:hypothetical protein
MQYEAVYLYNNRNEFIGVAIKKANYPQLHSINIWMDDPEDVEDFRQTLTALNEEGALRQYWPSAHDAEVAALVENPEWEELKLHEEEVPDWDASTIEEDEYGGIDYEQSNIVYKRAMVPDPTEAQARYYKAQETVARARLAAAQ